MINVYSKVKTLVEKPNAKVGTIGVVVSIYADQKGCEVEVCDSSNYPYDVITYELSEVEEIE